MERCGFTDILPQPIVQVKDIDHHIGIYGLHPSFLEDMQAREKDCRILLATLLKIQHVFILTSKHNVREDLP